MFNILLLLLIDKLKIVTYSCFMKLDNAVIIVTGASERLGRMLALAFAQKGASVIVHCHRDTMQADATVTQIKANGGRALRVASDLTTMSGIETLTQQTLEYFGQWDGLVNAASVFSHVGIDALDVTQWELDQRLHVRAPFFLSKALFDYKKRNKSAERGCIVNISDTGVRHPVASRPSYYSAKGALEEQVRILGIALAPLVRVNAVAPGAVIPANKSDLSYFNELEHRLPLQKLPSPEDVVAAVLFLFDNNSITGETIVVDGGEHLL